MKITDFELQRRNMLWGNYCILNSSDKGSPSKGKKSLKELKNYEKILFKKYQISVNTHQIKWSNGIIAKLPQRRK